MTDTSQSHSCTWPDCCAELRKQVAELQESLKQVGIDYRYTLAELSDRRQQGAELTAERDALQAKLNPPVLRCMHCDYATELQHVCEQCGERWAA